MSRSRAIPAITRAFTLQRRIISIRRALPRRQLRPGRIRNRRCWKAWLPPMRALGRRLRQAMTTIPSGRCSTRRRFRRRQPPVQARMHWRPTRERCLMRRRARPGQRQGTGFHRGQADRTTSRFHRLRQSNPGRHGVEQGFSSFSAQEASAAKAELNQRTRSSILNAFDPSSGGGGQGSSIALLQQYASMSPEERSVLGFTDVFANKIAQNYRTMSSIQSSFGSSSSGGLAAYL